MTTPSPNDAQKLVKKRVPQGLIPKLLTLLAVFGVAIFIGGYFLPTTWTVERTQVMPGPPEIVFDRINTLTEWSDWDPWSTGKSGETVTVMYTFEGEEGVGATRRWASKDIGRGVMKITESVPHTKVGVSIQFGEDNPPVQATFTLSPTDGGQTAVTWSIDGETSMRPLGNYLTLLIEQVVGPDIERGLQGLARQVKIWSE